MIPVAANVGLHHPATEQMRFITSIAFKKRFLLGGKRTFRPVESFSNNINYGLALFLGNHGLRKTGIQQACHRHRMRETLRSGGIISHVDIGWIVWGVCLPVMKAIWRQTILKGRHT